MRISKQSAFSLFAGAIALVSCQTVAVDQPPPIAIGKVSSQKSDAKMCRIADCVPAAGQTISVNDVLKSGSLSVNFKLFGANGATTSHKLLGSTDSWVREGEVIKARHVDGTLSGEVVHQPMRIQFEPSHNRPNRIANCEFSSGRYIAINYIIFRFEIQNGTAVCTDTKGKKHKITDGVFEEAL